LVFEKISGMKKMWTPLWSEIVTSSIWEEDVVVRVVWITMLAVMDWDGWVSGSVASMRRLANIKDEKECARALRVLESPDMRSPGQPNDGRRINRLPKGWVVLNHAKYREMIQKEYRRAYKADNAKKNRAKKKGPLSCEVAYEKAAEAGASEEQLNKLIDGR